MKSVICLGSWQGRDRVAWTLADRLQGHAHRGLDIHCCATLVQMFEQLHPGATVYVLDATPDLPAGTIARISPEDLARAPRCSSHGLDLASTLDLVDALGDAPTELHILALGVGAGDVSPEVIVEQLLPEVLRILDED